MDPALYFHRQRAGENAEELARADVVLAYLGSVSRHTLLDDEEILSSDKWPAVALVSPVISLQTIMLSSKHVLKLRLPSCLRRYVVDLHAEIAKRGEQILRTLPAHNKPVDVIEADNAVRGDGTELFPRAKHDRLCSLPADRPLHRRLLAVSRR